MIQKLGMPKWGLSMTEGRVVDWLVEEGAELAVGDEVAEVETEKINGVVEAPAAGVLRRRVAASNDVIPVGGLLGVIADAAATDEEIDAFVADFQATFVPGESEEDAGAQPETADTDAGRLRFLAQGEGGEPLVLLHGFGGDINNWLFNAEPLSSNRAVYALDLPGHGGSVKEAGDLVGGRAVLPGRARDQAGAPRGPFAGRARGGRARRRRPRPRALADADRAGRPRRGDRSRLRRRVRRRDRTTGPQAGAAAAVRRPGRGQPPDGRRRAQVQAPGRRAGGAGGAARPLLPGRPPGRAASTSTPTPGRCWSIWGERDAIIPAAHAEQRGRADVHVLPDVGHSPHMEAAGEVNRLLEGFLAGVRAG